jgi:methylated-DNA-[protein]-cysteine S-methyltransferase
METTYSATFTTPLGDVIATSNDKGVSGLWFAEHQLHLPDQSILSSCQPGNDHPLLLKVSAWLEAYFAGQNPIVDIPLNLNGSFFQLCIWFMLCGIKYGTTATYGELALQLQKSLGRERPPAAQAIGQAVGHNPISLIIPCHRVVGKNGRLTGYGGGLDRKEALLKLEGWL